MSGASRAFSEWGRCGARGRGDETHPPSPRAAPGLRPGTLRSPARSWLTAGRAACPRLKGAAAQKGLRSRASGGTKRNAGSAARRCHDAAMERREAPAFPPRNAALNDNGRAAWRSIPLSFCWGTKEDPATAGMGRRPTRGRKEYGRFSSSAWVCDDNPNVFYAIIFS